MRSTREIPSWRYASLALMLASMIVAFLALQQAAFADDVQPWRLVTVVALSPLLIPLHEMAHCLGYFVSLRSPNLITGLCPSTGAWYVVYDVPLPRWRVLVMLVSPFVLLAVIPCLAFPVINGTNAWLLAFVLLFQAGLCVGDLLTSLRIYLNVPSGAIVHNHEWTTCWATPDAVVSKALERSR